MAAIKKWFEKLKRGIKGDLVRDYSEITRDDDSINARLLRSMSDFNISVEIDHSEYGRADFKIPVRP